MDLVLNQLLRYTTESLWYCFILLLFDIRCAGLRMRTQVWL